MNYPSPNTKQAFTLAEVLITLGIIGIVSAITIPTLVKNYQEYSLKQAWKKEYSVFAQAYERIKQDEGGDLSAYFGGSVTGITLPLLYKFNNYLNIVKDCGLSQYICGTNPLKNMVSNDDYKSLSGDYVNYANLNQNQFILKDGTNIYMRAYNPKYSLIFVDVNGYSKKPNVLGKDLFGIILTKDKIMPMGAVGTGVENSCNSTSFKTSCPANYGFHMDSSCSGAGCSAEYLYN